jgi:hypothetical protein
VRTAHDIFSGLYSNYRTETNTGRPIVVPQQPQEERTTSTTTSSISVPSEGTHLFFGRLLDTWECDTISRYTHAPISHFYIHIPTHTRTDTHGHHGQDRVPVHPLPPVEVAGVVVGRCLGPSFLIIVVLVGAEGSDADISCDRGSGSVAGPSTSSPTGSLAVLLVLLLRVLDQ